MTHSTIIATEKSTHTCPIFQFNFEEAKKHPDADRLALYTIYDTDYSYVLNIADWQGYKGKVAWIPPDSLVDTTKPEFAFLIKDGKYNKDSLKPGTYARIKAKRLRGYLSYGLLVKVPDSIDGDAAQYLDVHHYEAPINNSKGGGCITGGEVASPPSGTYPKYDVDAMLKYGRKVFVSAEPVWIYEKLHGMNSKYIWKDGQMYCGSRTEWKKEFVSKPNLTLEELIIKTGDEQKAKEIYERVVVNFQPKRNMWWEVLHNTPTLRTFCEANEGYCVYGEVFGQVQDLKYGAKNGEIWFAAFDILRPSGQWMDMPDFQETCEKYKIPTCPLLYKDFPFDLEKLKEIVNGAMSQWPNSNCIAEGLVVTPRINRWDEKLGRVKLKLINPAYLER